MGSASTDRAYAIAADGNGNLYVAGYCSATWGSPVNAYAGGIDAFVAKLSASMMTPAIHLLLLLE
jgi:hypothetical protein